MTCYVISLMHYSDVCAAYLKVMWAFSVVKHVHFRDRVSCNLSHDLSVLFGCFCIRPTFGEGGGRVLQFFIERY